MSFSKISLYPIISVKELLAYDEDQLRQFLNECRIDDGFDVSRISDLNSFSVEQQAELITRLQTAAKEAGPLNIDALSSLLDKLINNAIEEDGNVPAQQRLPRSKTQSLTPEDPHKYQAYCYEALIQAGGRPATTLDLYEAMEKNTNIYNEITRPWLGDGEHDEPSDVSMLPLFERQLKDWASFKREWQWDIRGKHASDEGFASYLEAELKRWTYLGELEMISKPSFKTTTRRMWDSLHRDFETSGRQGFAAYAQSVEHRLSCHHFNFTQPFQLSEDPRQQSEWTTWVEYLNYIYWRLDKHAAAMKAAESPWRKARIELQHSSEAPSAATSLMSDGEDLNATKGKLEAVKEQIRIYVEHAGPYWKHEALVRRQELRAEWALGLLSSMDVESSAQELSTSKGQNKTTASNIEPRSATTATRDPTTDYGKHTVPELKHILKTRGIAVTGLKLKKQFIEKLQESDHPQRQPRNPTGIKGDSLTFTSKAEAQKNSVTPRRRSQRLHPNQTIGKTQPFGSGVDEYEKKRPNQRRKLRNHTATPSIARPT